MIECTYRISTYPTMLNAIDDTKNKDGIRLKLTPAHFDLIIIDESFHRSIF